MREEPALMLRRASRPCANGRPCMPLAPRADYQQCDCEEDDEGQEAAEAIAHGGHKLAVVPCSKGLWAG